MNVTIYFRDGTCKHFNYKGRPGGSYTNSIRYEGGVFIHRDEWGNETAIPLELIGRVESHPAR